MVLVVEDDTLAESTHCGVLDEDDSTIIAI